jgi:hypothetical protein
VQILYNAVQYSTVRRVIFKRSFYHVQIPDPQFQHLPSSFPQMLGRPSRTAHCDDDDVCVYQVHVRLHALHYLSIETRKSIVHLAGSSRAIYTTTINRSINRSIMATEPLPVPAQLKAQLDKCKSVRSAETFYKPRTKTPQVSRLRLFVSTTVGACWVIYIYIVSHYFFSFLSFRSVRLQHCIGDERIQGQVGTIARPIKQVSQFGFVSKTLF